jgi:predicted MPP superfamily phosphohydrolase
VRRALLAKPLWIAVTQEQRKLAKRLRISRQLVVSGHVHQGQARLDSAKKAV